LATRRKRKKGFIIPNEGRGREKEVGSFLDRIFKRNKPSLFLHRASSREKKKKICYFYSIRRSGGGGGGKGQ